MPSSVPTGLSRFLVSLAFLLLGAGVALLAVGQPVPGVGGLIFGGLLWAISLLFRSRIEILPIRAVSTDSRSAPAVVPDVTDGLRAASLDSDQLAHPEAYVDEEEEAEAEEPSPEELWEEAADALDAQARLGWKDPAEALSELKAWLAKGVDIHAEDEDGLTLFDRACIEGAPVEVLEGMARLGVNPRQHAYMLDKVLEESDPPAEHVVVYLLEQGANPNGNPRYARGVPNAELESGSSLLEICLDRELSDAIVAALLRFGAEDVWCDDEEESLLSMAIYRELPLSTIALLGQAFDVNAFHGIALRKAISDGQSVELLVELLSGLGANPFLRDDNDENAPAQLLIEDEHWEALKVVAEHLDLRGRHRLVGMVDALADLKAVADIEQWVETLAKTSEGRRDDEEEAEADALVKAMLKAVAAGQLLGVVRTLEHDPALAESLFREEPSPNLETVKVMLASRQHKPDRLLARSE